MIANFKYPDATKWAVFTVSSIQNFPDGIRLFVLDFSHLTFTGPSPLMLGKKCFLGFALCLSSDIVFLSPKWTLFLWCLKNYDIHTLFFHSLTFFSGIPGVLSFSYHFPPNTAGSFGEE